MKNLYLLHYNNYTNRIIKKLNSIKDYEQFLVGDVVSNVNFIPNDGITTTQVLNSQYELTGTPDYLVVTSLDDEITSRWFITECRRIRNGQYHLSLKRDSIADYLEKVLEAKSFIYKGHVSDNNPLIYNKEGLQFNQIKKSETTLKDYTKCPWIVGYLAPNANEKDLEIKAPIEHYYDYKLNNLSDYEFYRYSDRQEDRIMDRDSICVTVQPYVVQPRGDRNYIEYYLYANGSKSGSQLQTLYEPPTAQVGRNYTLNVKSPLDIWKEVADSSVISAIQTKVRNKLSETKQAKLLADNGKIIRCKDQGEEERLFRIHVNTYPYKPKLGDVVPESNIGYAIEDCFRDWTGRFKQSDMEVHAEYFDISFEDIGSPTSTQTAFSINLANKDITNNETPYGIICMPYSDVYSITSDNGVKEPHDLSAISRLHIMQSIGTIGNVSGNTILYDLQLLPYCPIKNLAITAQGEILTQGREYKTIPVLSAGEYQTSILISKQANISFAIPHTIFIDDIKRQNETDMWRLCSPNYSGAFEFNATKFFTGNYKVITSWDVDCTFKPYTPYIHVAPHFSGLYGSDFNDARGLICGGDFSVDRVSDAWATYQYNNKNFQLQFDRQIQSMELQKNWNMASGITQGIVGGVGSAIMGGLVGGPLGAAAGLTTGAIDATFNGIEQNALASDAISAAKDQHRWALGNIQALPYGLTKVSALNGNNKLYPFVEYYTCTLEEAKMFNEKIKYEGMTVNSMGQIREYLSNENNSFIKAEIMRLEDLKEDSHFLADLNMELRTGVYIND